jgi:hypothetical protein
MSLRYERRISIEFPINSQDRVREFFIKMQKDDFFLGEFKHCMEEHYYVPYVETRQDTAFVFISEDDVEMFSTDYQYESQKISTQLTTNGFNHTVEQIVEESEKTIENEIPTLAFLYLTDKEPTSTTIEGEEMSLDVYLSNYNWRNELSIVYKVQWSTDTKQAPKEIESRMNDYFISEITDIQNVLLSGLLEFDIVTNEPVLDCKFECMNHTSQVCSPEIADATLNRIQGDEASITRSSFSE